MLTEKNKQRIIELLKKMSPLEEELMKITLSTDGIEHERLYSTVLAFQRVYCALFMIKNGGIGADSK